MVRGWPYFLVKPTAATRLHLKNYPGIAGISPAVALQGTVGTTLPMDKELTYKNFQIVFAVIDA